MIFLTILILSTPHHQVELNQAVQSILKKDREAVGLLRCGYYRDMSEENALMIMEEWDTWEALESYLRSESFSVMQGALKLLTESVEIRFHTVSNTSGEEVIRAVRDAMHREA